MHKTITTGILQSLKFLFLAILTSLVLHRYTRFIFTLFGLLLTDIFGESLGLLIGYWGCQIIILLIIWSLSIKKIHYWLFTLSIQVIVYCIAWLFTKNYSGALELTSFASYFDPNTPLYVVRQIGDILVIQVIAALMLYPKAWLISIPVQLIVFPTLWYYQIGNIYTEHFISVFGTFLFTQIAVMGLKWIYSLSVRKKKSKIAGVESPYSNPI